MDIQQEKIYLLMEISMKLIQKNFYLQEFFPNYLMMQFQALNMIIVFLEDLNKKKILQEFILEINTNHNFDCFSLTSAMTISPKPTL